MISAAFFILFQNRHHFILHCIKKIAYSVIDENADQIISQPSTHTAPKRWREVYAVIS